MSVYSSLYIYNSHILRKTQVVASELVAYDSQTLPFPSINYSVICSLLTYVKSLFNLWGWPLAQTCFRRSMKSEWFKKMFCNHNDNKFKPESMWERIMFLATEAISYGDPGTWQHVYFYMNTNCISWSPIPSIGYIFPNTT